MQRKKHTAKNSTKDSFIAQRIEPELKKQLKELAINNGITPSEVVKILLIHEIKKHKGLPHYYSPFIDYYQSKN